MEKKNNDDYRLAFWNERWQQGQTGWDIGYPSPSICEYMQEKVSKDAAILIPGCGNAYEAEWLLQQGFKDITLVDIAPKAVEILKEKFRGSENINIICGNFFEMDGSFDVMVEQTFFCAIDRNLRKAYVEKATSLLKQNGKIIGLLFGIEFEKEGPPHGGSKEEYHRLFQELFEIKNLDTCLNSIAPRAGNELFIEFEKRNLR
ncbi:MAG TPA: methyltransferase domain-containing protein [Edaphocola sp.]|nr:methyltransferase domain-containing protein [Edaphocola sp.]